VVWVGDHVPPPKHQRHLALWPVSHLLTSADPPKPKKLTNLTTFSLTCRTSLMRLGRTNRHVTNPIQRKWAGWAPSFGILEDVGRSSGKPYRLTDVRRAAATSFAARARHG
jgi:hypothetical protein